MKTLAAKRLGGSESLARASSLGLILAAMLLASCAGLPEEPAAPEAGSVTDTASAISTWRLPGEAGAFMKANLPTIQERRLSNGVTLIVKRNPANRVRSLKIAYRGGSAMTSPERAGLEAMTLAMMARGSRDYPYSRLKRMQYERSSSIGYQASSYDWASLDLTTLDKYWDEMLAAFVDCAVRPAFDPAQFDLVKNDFRVGLQKAQADPYAVAVTRLHAAMFKGHPYEAEFGGTLASISSITLEDVKAYHQSAMAADRMAIVAVGDIDIDELAAALDATLGALPRVGVTVPEVPPLRAVEALQLERFDATQGIAYVRGDYPIADPRSPDFITLQLAYAMLDELLFSVVRTDHGACYSTWSKAFGFKAPYGSLVIYKTDRPTEAKGYADEAIAVLASGRTLNLRGGDERYAPIAATLPAYKAKFKNAFFGNQQTNAETAAQLASSLVYYGDHREYLRLIDKIDAVSAADVIACVKAYIVDAQVSWIVVADQATLSRVDGTVFQGFTGRIEEGL